MLFLACLCDTFDGKIARSTPNRTASQRFYGVQLDSLCDVISFGVTPCFIAYSFGFDGWFDVLIYCLFVTCGTIRLAYFNTLSFENQGKPMKTFRGIPIPMSTIVICTLFMLTTFIPASITVWIFRIALIALALGYILNIRVKKPNVKSGAIFLGAQILVLIILLIAGDCQAPTV
jgi:CDP-diacylglycerol--serine O-phosphatidyltransferase